MTRLQLWPVADARGASTRYRVLAYLERLRAAGFRPEVRFPLGLGRAPAPLWRALDLARDVWGAPPADLLFIHRKTYPPPFAARLARAGRPIVFDLDDAIDLPPPGAAADEGDRARYRRNFEATVEAADLVLCGNRYLASRLPHDRWELLPTVVDTERFHPDRHRRPDRPTLGWVGYSDNLPYLEALAGPLAELARRHPGLSLKVVADRPPRLDGIDVVFERWTLQAELSAFDDISIGLMPLVDDAWTRGKCAFKAVQYMAFGIPSVASPVGANRELIEDGVDGLLPADDRGWFEAIERLLADPQAARSIGEAGRRKVVEGYSLEAQAPRLIRLLNERAR